MGSPNGASCAAHRSCAGISHSARMLGACHPQPTQADHACLCPDAPRPFGRPCPSCRCLQLAGKRPTALPGTSHSAWRAARDAPPGVGDAVGRAAPFAAPRAPLPYRLMATSVRRPWPLEPLGPAQPAPNRCCLSWASLSRSAAACSNSRLRACSCICFSSRLISREASFSLISSSSPV